jgi:hypothetical protein
MHRGLHPLIIRGTPTQTSRHRARLQFGRQRQRRVFMTDHCAVAVRGGGLYSREIVALYMAVSKA